MIKNAIEYENAAGVAAVGGAQAVPVCGRPIGSLLREARHLSEDQLARIASYQRKTGMRFGEAAVALRFAERNDVLNALSRQFEYSTGFAGKVSAELAAAADPFSELSDAFRELRSRLLLEVLNEQSRCALALVSPQLGDGKTYLSANLAFAFSQLGEPTLLIDADMRTPRQARLFGVEHGPGLSSILAGHAEASGAVQPIPGMASLHLLQAGPVPPNPLELLQRPAFGALLQDMLERFSHVIVDTPAAARGADCRVIAARCGAALVLARRRHSRMEPLEGLLAMLARSPARIAGVVMNEH